MKRKFATVSGKTLSDLAFQLNHFYKCLAIGEGDIQVHKICKEGEVEREKKFVALISYKANNI